jgi:NADP-dependent 3-hydroxy acid dehydrogenase YdfG
MAREGVRLALADVQAEALTETARELSENGAEVEAISLDVRDFEECRAAVARTVERFGQLDILVNSAGIGGTYEFFADSAPEDWQHMPKSVSQRR